MLSIGDLKIKHCLKTIYMTNVYFYIMRSPLFYFQRNEKNNSKPRISELNIDTDKIDSKDKNVTSSKRRDDLLMK